MLGRTRSTVVSALTGLCLLAGIPVAGQTPPPDADWFTFETQHFRVTYHAGLEELARHAAAVAEQTYEVLRVDLVRAPRGSIEVVVTDHVDFSNGFASPFTTNRIVVFARPPVAMPGLAFSRDWLELVVAHELVHIFHLDHAGPVGRAVRSVFGRIPMVWPLFPALGTPVWNVEGLATYYESRLTGAGRVHGSYHDMVIRTAALEAAIPRLSQVSAPSPVWPGGERSYVYGAALMEWIAGEYGPEAHSALLDATYGSVLPTFLFVDRIARRALGRSFTSLYHDWRAAATDSAVALRDRLAGVGLTPAETVVRHGPYAVAPRVSPDGLRLSYAGHDYRSDAATRIVDLATGQATTLARRNQFGGILGPASWLPDGSALVLAQLEYQGRYRLLSDLWLVDLQGRERRLTRDQRLAQPHMAPDGRRIAAVQSHQGSIRLVEHDLVAGETRVISDAAPGEAFDSPRWAPDGRRIAVTRYAGGRVDIVVVDVGTGEITGITSDEALNGDPSWSPDGQWILFWSDRTGIPNLFAARPPAQAAGVDPLEPAAAQVWQVTNVLTGAFSPEVSPDGESLFFVGFHHHGWRVQRTAFEPAAWVPAAPPVIRYERGLLPPPAAVRSRATAPEAAPEAPDAAPSASVAADRAQEVGGPARPYSPLPGARPHFWGPTYGSVGSTQADQASRFLGVFTMGWDVLQQHTWSGAASYDIDTGRLAGGARWTWTGLGNPDVILSAHRDWSGAGRITMPDGHVEAVLERQDRFGLDAVFWRRQWRRTAWIGVGSDIRSEQYQTYQLGDQDLARAGLRLPDLPTLASIAVRPGFSNVRQHPYSISRQDGIATSVGAGRWWNVTDGQIAYDQLTGSFGAYRGYRLWGFADHVTALRAAGLRRTGPDARTASIGGTPGHALDILLDAIPTGPFLPVRGFQSGERFGTRAWAASAEYRFPIHLSGEPGPVLGFSLTSVAGSLFADVGHAWCTPLERESERFRNCPAADDDPLASIGAEIAINFGVVHSFPLSIRYGFALPLSGVDDRGITFHVGVGPSF
jgi:Tol biopolymer transport system component